MRQPFRKFENYRKGGSHRCRDDVCMRERETPTEIGQKLKEVNEIVKNGLEKLVGEVKEGHTENYLEYLAFASRFHKYSHFNQMFIFSQKPDATLVAGYRTWQEMVIR